MSVTIFIPGPLRDYCNGASKLDSAAATVRAALGEIESRHPALYPNICDETGAVRRHVNIFVNDRHMRDLEGLDSKLVSGDEVIIMPSVSGG